MPDVELRSVFKSVLYQSRFSMERSVGSGDVALLRALVATVARSRRPANLNDGIMIALPADSRANGGSNPVSWSQLMLPVCNPTQRGRRRE